MNIFKDENGYHFGRNIISLEPKEEELKPIIRELEQEKPKEYSLSEYLSDKPFSILTFSIFFLGICPFSFFYFLDLISFENLEYGLTLGDAKAFNAIERPIFISFCVFIPFLMIDLFCYSNIKSDRNEKIKHLDARITYFKNKIALIVRKRTYGNEPAISFNNVPDGHYFPPYESSSPLEIIKFCVTVILCLLFITGINREYIETEKQGAFNSIHYISGQYVIFKKTDYNIEQIKIPRGVKVNITISDENSFKSRWISFTFVGKKHLNEGTQNYLNIKIKNDEYIKGSLIGHQ